MCVDVKVHGDEPSDELIISNRVIISIRVVHKQIVEY